MIDFNTLTKADNYVKENIDEYFNHIVKIESDDWNEHDKEIFKLGLSNGMRHGYYDAIREHKGEV